MPENNFWDSRYAADDYVYGTAPNDFLASQAHRFAPASRVLSLGEGEGRNAVYLASLGHRVCAVEGSRAGCDKIRRLAATRGIEVDVVHADLAGFLPEAATFDAVVSVFCHLDPALRKAVLARAGDALVDGGVFLIEAYTPRQLAFGTGGPREPELLLEPAHLVADLPRVRWEWLQETERELIEGRCHSDRAAVVQGVAYRQAR
ncbi:SAM-dependent methyltransferase [Crenobacter intestini]|uniref:Class I SAM-dependent methyltransferase n=1 Tax=Crenobacter intestini TaxID=2563443 RepID=A0A4V4N971_9NEIS|nr:class I SAM-dependent methyltransferase [Crenobacter intestini]TIC87163.1 class I SAM-dependent methyltransferase [Crenobacter intestini]